MLSMLGLFGCSTLQQQSSVESPHSVIDEARNGAPPAATQAQPSAQPQAQQQPTESSSTTAPSPATSSGTSASATASSQDDLWVKMREGFTLPDKHRHAVAADLKWYADRPDYVQRMFTRAQPFLYYILKQVRQRGMPTEIALLPAVESAFRPLAYSRSRAAGMWQFIPSTGIRFGLKQNWWYDGRRDVAASTRAALDYLQKLHDEFNGDWLLALAAYNSGEATVAAAIERNRRRDRPTDFWNLDLPAETRDYVPRLLAVSQLVADPQKYGLSLPPIPDRPYLAHVDVGSQIDLAVAARMAGVPVQEIYRLNPGFNRWATDPNGPFTLLLPMDRAAAFREKLADLPADQRMRWERYRIARGETLDQIAQRHRITVALLRQINHLRGNLIRAGHHLLIPMSGAVKVAANDVPPAYRADPPLRHAVTGRIVRTVRPGDTLWNIARNYGVSVAALARWNAMGSRSELKPGQRLVILARAPGLNAVGHERKVIHTVRAGDTLWNIARHYRVSVGALARWNSIQPQAALKPGRKLVVWLAGTGKPALAVAPASYVTLADARRRITHYTVRPGDSLFGIAQRFKVSVADLRRWNSLFGRKYLRPGQRLKVYVKPGQVPETI
ncbi:MAG: LysM peptidoglycan-binding domain-containing protein [Gammaproteobacteria bacterium]|nr:LysM peptidoglycan-binding domain-containing protein [Gammaproteobacteria bacterium]